MNKSILVIVTLLFLINFLMLVSAKDTLIGGGYVCDHLIGNAGSVKLVNFSYPNVEVEVTSSHYIGNPLFGLFYPMKLMTENLAADIKIEDNNYIYGPEHLNLILDKYYRLNKYPIKENYVFQVGGQYKYEINFFLRAKTFADVFTSKCTQSNLGTLEICTDQLDGKCPPSA